MNPGLSAAVGRPLPVIAEIGTRGDLPAAAAVVQALRDVIGRERCTAADVARIIRRDPGLAAKVLRLVNSAFYRHRSEQVATVSRAVIQLGFQAVRDLTGSILLLEGFAREQHSGTEITTAIRRALFDALTAERLAAWVGHVATEEAYLLGLFAHLGHLWIATFYPQELAEARALAEAEGLALADAEARTLGVHPRELAAAILKQWNFPPAYIRWFHHDPAEWAGLPARLATVVDVATTQPLPEAAESPHDPGHERALARFQTLFHLGPHHARAAAALAAEALGDQMSLLGLEAPTH